MENVTSGVSNSFGIGHPGPAVPGYGDANADLHVVGDHPGHHGGAETGVPFTDAVALRAEVVTGCGVLPVPVADPTDWAPADERALRERLAAILSRDYRRTKGVATRVG